jgi:hypothetical protein
MFAFNPLTGKLDLVNPPTPIDTDVTMAADSDLVVPSQHAVVQYILTMMAGLMHLKGDLDCSLEPNYPPAAVCDFYYCSVAGKIGGASGVVVSVGDVIICKTANAGGTQASVGAYWFVLEANIPGLTYTGVQFATLPNPNAISFVRINADNTVSALSLVDFKTALGIPSYSAIGTNLATVVSGSAINYIRVNADDSITLLSAEDYRAALGTLTISEIWMMTGI